MKNISILLSQEPEVEAVSLILAEWSDVTPTLYIGDRSF
jgi:hypothetical protein